MKQVYHLNDEPVKTVNSNHVHGSVTKVFYWKVCGYHFVQQIAELKAKRDQNHEQEKQKKTRIEHLEKTVKHQQQELKKRASQVAEFERVRILF